MSVTALQVLQGVRLLKDLLGEGIELYAEMTEESRDLTPAELAEVKRERDERAASWSERLERARLEAASSGSGGG